MRSQLPSSSTIAAECARWSYMEYRTAPRDDTPLIDIWQNTHYCTHIVLYTGRCRGHIKCIYNARKERAIRVADYVWFIYFLMLMSALDRLMLYFKEILRSTYYNMTLKDFAISIKYIVRRSRWWFIIMIFYPRTCVLGWARRGVGGKPLLCYIGRVADSEVLLP